MDDINEAETSKKKNADSDEDIIMKRATKNAPFSDDDEEDYLSPM